MFKELDQWMREVEEEYLTSYQKARAALDAWTAAKHNFWQSCNVSMYEIQDTLHGDYHMYGGLQVSENYEERQYSDDNAKIEMLVGFMQVGGDKKYTIPLATGYVKGERICYEAFRVLQRDAEKELDAREGFSWYLCEKQVHKVDVEIVKGRDDEWIVNRAHKDMLRLKEAIEAKIKKICGNIASVDEDCAGYMVRGTNGRVAHLWRIMAGGYNIQRLHTRVLCKEVKLK